MIYRYEKKFYIQNQRTDCIINTILTHPYGFKEIHKERKVNNIYFDTHNYSSYRDNLSGTQNRVKIRLRWYGKTFGVNKQCILEYKIKKNQLGVKQSYKVVGIDIDVGFSKKSMISQLTKNIPTTVRSALITKQLALLNSYNRRYFSSFDRKFRFTVDTDLRYYMIQNGMNKFLNKTQDRNAIILELKYDRIHQPIANKITSKLPYIITKSSKYAYGINTLYGGLVGE